MPPLVAAFIGGIFALLGLSITNLFFRHAPFWVPVTVGVSVGLIAAVVLLFWSGP